MHELSNRNLASGSSDYKCAVPDLQAVKANGEHPVWQRSPGSCIFLSPGGSCSHEVPQSVRKQWVTLTGMKGYFGYVQYLPSFPLLIARSCINMQNALFTISLQ